MSAIDKAPHAIGLSVVLGLVLASVQLAWGLACVVGLVVGAVLGAASIIVSAHIAVDRFAAGPKP